MKLKKTILKRKIYHFPVMILKLPKFFASLRLFQVIELLFAALKK